MRLAYDPGENESFWAAIRNIPGYPVGEEMPIRRMIFESGAVFQLPDVLRLAGAHPKNTLWVVMDSTPMRRGEADLKALVVQVLKDAGWNAEALVLGPDSTGQVHADMPNVRTVQSRLHAGDGVLSVGSGSITDVAKHAAHLFEKELGDRPPFVVFQTANSVSAYTSNMAPVFIDGVKRTLPSRYPDALICDLETLRDAPREMTVAGVGDLLAAFVSFPDWYLANRLGLDSSYTEFPQTLVGPLDETFLAHAEAIRTGSLDGMAVLAKVIALGGLAMSLAHATTPMSGFEHVMSHILDLLAEQARRPLAQHGTQVALATVIGAETYRRFLSEFDPDAVRPGDCYPSAELMRARIDEAFAPVDPSGKAGAECWADYKIKLEAWHAHRSEFESVLREWGAVRENVERYARPPERIAQILQAVGSPMSFASLTPPAAEAEAKFAFLNAPLMRKRLTIGDLLIFLNRDRESLWTQAWTRSQALGG